MVDAVAYNSTKDIEKLDILPIHIRDKVLLTVGPTGIRICLPKINFAPMNSDLGALQETMPSIRSKKLERIERRSFRIATLSMATGSFRSLSPRTLKEQGELFHEHIESIHHLLMEKNPFQPDEIAVCVLPEFYSYCLNGRVVGADITRLIATSSKALKNNEPEWNGTVRSTKVENPY